MGPRSELRLKSGILGRAFSKAHVGAFRFDSSAESRFRVRFGEDKESPTRE